MDQNERLGLTRQEIEFLTQEPFIPGGGNPKRHKIYNNQPVLTQNWLDYNAWILAEHDPNKPRAMDGCFGFINGTLYIAVKHHALIMKTLIDEGWTWEELFNAEQAWGWWAFGLKEGDTWRIAITFSTDAARHDEPAIAGARQTFYNWIQGLYPNTTIEVGGESGAGKVPTEYGQNFFKKYPDLKEQFINNPEERASGYAGTKIAANVVNVGFKHDKNDFFTTSFAFINDTLYLADRHHSAIIYHLIKNGMSMEELASTPSTWGWMWRADHDMDYGTHRQKEGKIYVQFFSDVAVVKPALFAKTRAAMKEFFGENILYWDSSGQRNQGQDEFDWEYYERHARKLSYDEDDYDDDYYSEERAVIEPQHESQQIFNPKYYWKFIYDTDRDELVRIWATDGYYGHPYHTNQIYAEYGDEWDDAHFVAGYMDWGTDPRVSEKGIIWYGEGEGYGSHVNEEYINRAMNRLKLWAAGGTKKQSQAFISKFVEIDSENYDEQVGHERPIFYYIPTDTLYIGKYGSHHMDIAPYIFEEHGIPIANTIFGGGSMNDFIGLDWEPGHRFIIYLDAYGNFQLQNIDQIPKRLLSSLVALDPGIPIYWTGDNGTFDKDYPSGPLEVDDLSVQLQLFTKKAQDSDIDFAEIKFVSLPHRLLVGENTYHAYLLKAQYGTFEWPEQTLAIGRAIMSHNEINAIGFDWVKSDKSQEHAIRQISEWAEQKGYILAPFLTDEKYGAQQLPMGIKFIYHPDYGLGYINSPIAPEDGARINIHPNYESHQMAFAALPIKPNFETAYASDPNWVVGVIGEGKVEMHRWLSDQPANPTMAQEVVKELLDKGLIDENTEIENEGYNWGSGLSYRMGTEITI